METRRRNLIILGSATVVSLALAAFALEQRAAEGRSRYTPTDFLPGFAASVKNAAAIHVAGKDGAFDVVDTGKGWVVQQRGNYPANFDEVRHTLIGAAGLQTIAPRTSNPAWLHYLSLDAPTPANAKSDGIGTEFTVKDKAGTVLADFIAGHTEELGDANGATGLFVRKPNENQAYLARSVFTPHGDVQTWLEPKVLELGNTRLQEVVMTPLKGPAFIVSRPGASVQIFTLANAPAKSQPNSQLINSIPFALANFTFTDVKPVEAADFAKPSHVGARTFDGLIINMDVIQQGADYWARISASTAPGAKPDVVQQAATINTRTGGFEYKVPAEKGKPLTTDQATILTPPPAPPQAPGTVDISRFMGGTP